MYDFVKNKQELKELKEACESIIKNVQNSFLRDYFTFQFHLIGSGMNNLITQNGETGEYDLDYNFILQKDKQNLFSNPKKIKELYCFFFLGNCRFHSLFLLKCNFRVFQSCNRCF